MTSPTRGTVWFRTGPPRRLNGLTTGGYSIRFGVLLPPAAGPARTAALETTGGRLLDKARRDYGRVLREVLTVGGEAVPPPSHLDRPQRPDLGRELVSSRRARWGLTRERLGADPDARRSRASGPLPLNPPTLDLRELELRARAALDAAVSAFDHLEDTDLAAKAHAQAHTIGELVAGLFGCRTERKDGRWFDVCRLSLMHLRVGLSPGFVARPHCSICDGDLAGCPHDPGATYSTVAARRPDGSCTICDSTDCNSHVPGATYHVQAHGIVRHIDRLDEISMVARPRDPSARLRSVEIPRWQIRALSGHDDPNAVLYCERCTSPCTGFTSAEEAIGLA